MYNIVFSKEADGFFVSVFDKKGNEIYNIEGVDEKNGFEKVKSQKFKINNYITSYEYNGIFVLTWCINPPCIDLLLTTQRSVQITDKPIANESFHGYGLNRYLHRQFLKLTR